MAISVFDLFTLGIGPSSSHTVGPMRAAHRFVTRLEEAGHLSDVRRLQAELFGSLALTGKGHGTDRAVLMGLEGEDPETINTETVRDRVEKIAADQRLNLFGRLPIAFEPKRDLLFHYKRTLPYHPNGMTFTAFGNGDEPLLERTYYSVGGGFVVNDDAASHDRIVEDQTELRFPFHSGAELLDICATENLDVASVMMANETAWRSEEEIRAGLDTIVTAMQATITAGCRNEGVLPGGLNVTRRAPALYKELTERPEAGLSDPLTVLDWVALYAMAVNEENAAGGRVVTAPTNGAAGILPAVAEYYRRFVPTFTDEGMRTYLLTCAAIGLLYKENASISGAEVGCQGEVGVACSMAAGGLAAVMGGSVAQVENAAEIGMEHNLGLTCDPVRGLVQIPCIERNAMGATKAIQASRLALRGKGTQKVSLDKVIETMRQTGEDMKTKYKETSRGGLAINVIEC
jgi:L-serine dehydratase